MVGDGWGWAEAARRLLAGAGRVLGGLEAGAGMEELLGAEQRAAGRLDSSRD